MKTRAPELSALIIILRSTGPVISQRRSSQIGRRWGDPPVAGADRPRPRVEARILTGVEPRLPVAAALQQLEPSRVQRAVQTVDEIERLTRERLAIGQAVNCASSVEPLSASVEASGDTACVTRSK